MTWKQHFFVSFLLVSQNFAIGSFFVFVDPWKKLFLVTGRLLIKQGRKKRERLHHIWEFECKDNLVVFPHPHLRAHHLRWIYGFLKPTQFTIGQTSRIYPGCTRFVFFSAAQHTTHASKIYRNTQHRRRCVEDIQKHKTRAGTETHDQGRLPNQKLQMTWGRLTVYMGGCPIDLWTHSAYKYTQYIHIHNIYKVYICTFASYEKRVWIKVMGTMLLM